MQHSDPQESKDIHSVAAPGGCALGSLGAGASKPPKTWLPFSERWLGFCPPPHTSLPFPRQSHKQELVQGQRTLPEVSPPGASSGMWKVGVWLQKRWMPACRGSGRSIGGRGAGGISSGGWRLPPSSGALLIFPFWWVKWIMPSRCVSLDPFLNVRIIRCPTVASQLLAISNISSLIKNEGGNSRLFLRGNWGFLCLLWAGAQGWMLNRGHHSTGCHHPPPLNFSFIYLFFFFFSFPCSRGMM